MSKHYNNNGKSYLFSEAPEKMIISVSYKKLSIAGLTSLLVKIIETYEEVNTTTPLVISLDRFLPPPPIPSKNEEYIKLETLSRE